MKQFTTLLRWAFFISTLLVINSGLMAQTIYVDDGASVNLVTGTNTNEIVSTVATNSSTANIEANGVVVLQGDYSGFYGNLYPLDGKTLSLNTSSYVAKLKIGNASYTSATTVNINKSSGVTISSDDGSGNTIVMDKYGVLKINNDLNLNNNLVINNYDAAAAPVIWFYPAATTPKITISNTSKTILTDEPTYFRVDVSKHFAFDMTNAPQSSVGLKNFTIATFADAGSLPGFVGTPSLTNDPDGVWTNPSVDVSSSNLRLTTTYDPPFENDFTAGGYSNNFPALATIATADGTELLRKAYALTADNSLTKSFFINLDTYILSGSKTVTIAAGKYLGLSGTTGSFNNSIRFSDFTSELLLRGGGTNVFNLLGNDFTVTGTDAGSIQIGDGTTITTGTLNSATITKFNGKVSRIVVKSNTVLTIDPSI